MPHRSLIVALGLIASATSLGAPAGHRTAADDWTYVPVEAPAAAPADLAPVPREFRGAWVASVANIDWPSEPGLSTERQQLELLAILDRAAALRLNAVIFQVRPAADALYPSPLEPWSEYLTGEMGKAPEPFWDPLAFAVAEAHRRGLELHAWFNPYRARHVGAKSPVSADHVSRTNPAWVKKYGGYLWMDPGEPEVQERSMQVVLDVVRRYDVDAVHIDDYFYPYRVQNPRGRGYLQFPDDASWAKYRAKGGTLSRDDWRRRNVDQFVERLYREVKREKAWVKVGVSPFGIWRPGHPERVRGLDAFQEIYADSRKWVQNGWLDYAAPQLYWPTSAPQQPYAELLRWWVEQNAHQRHIWPGNYTSRVGDARQPKWTPAELLEQVRLTRAEAGATGNIHFSMKALLQDFGRIVEPLSLQAYAQPALVPASPWLARTPPPQAAAQPSTSPAAGGGVQLALAASGAEPVRTWVVRSRRGQRWEVRLVPGEQRGYVVEPDARGVLPEEIAVSAVDRVGREGPAQLLERQRRW